MVELSWLTFLCSERYVGRFRKLTRIRRIMNPIGLPRVTSPIRVWKLVDN